MIGRVSTAVEYASEESSPWGALKLIAGNANRELAQKISEEIGVSLTDPRLTRYSDGEIDVKIEDSMRGHDVFVIQPTCHPVNEHLMELFIILDALRRASAGRVTAVIPYYGYARKERKSQPREPISAKLIANFIVTHFRLSMKIPYRKAGTFTCAKLPGRISTPSVIRFQGPPEFGRTSTMYFPGGNNCSCRPVQT